MPKYEPLEQFLSSQPSASKAITMSFSQIGKLLGSPLPTAASEHKAWWLDHSAGTTHVQALAWMQAGWRVEAGDLDLPTQKVTFRRD